jgi:Papain fold toxin 1, glutamine deamidase
MTGGGIFTKLGQIPHHTNEPSCDWAGGGGHWFNAVNDAGTILAVDGQRNRAESWPPSYRGVRFEETEMRCSDALYFDPGGKAVDR